MIDDLRPSPIRGLLNPVLLLTGLTFAVALVLLPFALARSGSGGLLGLAAAGGICFIAGAIAELIAWTLSATVQPLGLMFVGMAVRMLPPLSVCVYLAANSGGREHQAFIGYLLAFYLTTLALETFLTVKRVATSAPTSKPSPR